MAPHLRACTIYAEGLSSVLITHMTLSHGFRDNGRTGTLELPFGSTSPLHQITTLICAMVPARCWLVCQSTQASPQLALGLDSLSTSQFQFRSGSSFLTGPSNQIPLPKCSLSMAQKVRKDVYCFGQVHLASWSYWIWVVTLDIGHRTFCQK